MSNPSTRQARALVAGLIVSGVDHLVIAPGSRNGPLSIAAVQAAAAGRLEVHVRVDERSASFLALGIAKRLRRPAAVLCTSGTAAAHFTAAAFEATEAGVPLVLLTADRPADVRGKGANQTIDQVDMFGNAVTFAFDLEVAEDQPDEHWMAIVLDAVKSSRGNDLVPPGAVHLNIPFAEPLLPPDLDATWTADLPDDGELFDRPTERGQWHDLWPEGGATPRGVVVTSDPLQAEDALEFARALQWPVLAEPGSGARVEDVGIRRYLDIVSDPAFTPDVVVTLGRFALSRPIGSLVQRAHRHVAVGRLPLDPFDSADAFMTRLPDVSGVAPTDDAWLSGWQAADEDAMTITLPRSASIANTALACVRPGDLVHYGPSSVIRYAERVAPLFDDVVLSQMNRGTNGIDGVVSSAIGAGLAHDGFTLALMGDLTFLHDVNGLFIPQGARVPDIAFVVIDSDGGRIFASLEQGAPQYAQVFDAIYRTPHGRDVAAISAAYGARSTRVASHEALISALLAAREAGGINVIVFDDRESTA